ncbi:uncharacterized protein LOC131937915 [Physella acuta]|uniref:uncharacterized protein LOC131937915 n=1 Tax=Physella acuta TaxID=109671 RepID=UPI0027DD1553|nr:uncharacterized protein LOC131937915 [Physella acuta]
MEDNYNSNYLQVPGVDSNPDNRLCGSWRLDASDKYTAAIELSNRCREFYNSRVVVANSMKTRWRDSLSDTSSSSSSSAASSPTSSSSSLSQGSDDSRSSRRQRSGVDLAMEKLRAEMVSLMDQDLSLMKQLLTLNETIEELKWQRQYYSCSSLSSRDVGSNWSVSDTEMYESDDDLVKLADRQLTTDIQLTTDRQLTTLVASDVEKNVVDQNANSSRRPADRVSCPQDDAPRPDPPGSVSNVWYSQLASRGHVINSGPIVIRHERDQNSFDSGIHEASASDDVIWNV